jgi:hypothetical protein
VYPYATLRIFSVFTNPGSEAGGLPAEGETLAKFALETEFSDVYGMQTADDSLTHVAMRSGLKICLCSGSETVCVGMLQAVCRL